MFNSLFNEALLKYIKHNTVLTRFSLPDVFGEIVLSYMCYHGNQIILDNCIQQVTYKDGFSGVDGHY